ncbi:aquaporin [Streptomyces sp. NPDC058861]|uniref:aquaporin n=1 Tax=Streptomyces sp. NPDC058861 TaxID=3346653 RepID=UPI00367AA107
MEAPLRRRALAELIGTAALVAVVVGSGIQAAELTQDAAVRLLANALATVLGLVVLIALLGPVSGAHFNPAVTLALWWTGRRDGSGPAARDVAAYLPAQTAGAVGGAILANAVFAGPLVSLSTRDRSAGHLWLAETVATGALVLLVLGLGRTGQRHLAPVLVASCIGAAYWCTSSTSFANPAVTVGRVFSDTFAGIAPASVPPFVAAQVLGAGAGVALAAALFGRAPEAGRAPESGPAPEAGPVPVPAPESGPVPVPAPTREVPT